MLLRDLGADVIKTEDPNGGDYARWISPLVDGIGLFFRASNRGKKSVVIDLKSGAGQAVLHKLVESADVLIEGFRPGVTARLGADFETLKAIEPKFWANFCAAVEKPEWLEQQRDRQRQPDLAKPVADLFKTKTADEWAAMLEDADCCFAPVIAPGQLLDEPQIQARGMVGVSANGLPRMRSPIRLSGDGFESGEAPAYGEHTRETLAEIGYAAVEIEALIDAGIIRQAP